MSINELPDECLLIIFRLINDLDDLLNCYKVCSKWNHLIEERTKKVKYLVEHDGNWPNDEQFPSCTPDYVYYRSEEPIDATCLSTLFPNLIIGDFSYGFCKKVKLEDIATLFKEIKSLKGLIHEFYNKNDPIIHYWDQLEMVSSGYIEPCMENASANIKQLHLWNYTLDEFKKGAQYFPNLERLSIHNNEGSPDWLYDGPILRKLKIVELSLSSYDGTDIYYGFQFMDSCPNLQSAHIKLDSNRIFVDESVKHTSLRDLVLHFYPEVVDWNELKRLFMKYPNLTHLSLVGNKSLDDEQVEQLVRILPNLVLFAVRGCPAITQKAANYVQHYNKLHGRSIKFYFDGNYHEIGPDWPQLSTKSEKISLGFDFMKHCFLKHFHFLSTFLISDDEEND